MASQRPPFPSATTQAEYHAHAQNGYPRWLKRSRQVLLGQIHCSFCGRGWYFDCQFRPFSLSLSICHSTMGLNPQNLHRSLWSYFLVVPHRPSEHIYSRSLCIHNHGRSRPCRSRWSTSRPSPSQLGRVYSHGTAMVQRRYRGSSAKMSTRPKCCSHHTPSPPQIQQVRPRYLSPIAVIVPTTPSLVRVSIIAPTASIIPFLFHQIRVSLEAQPPGTARCPVLALLVQPLACIVATIRYPSCGTRPFLLISRHPLHPCPSSLQSWLVLFRCCLCFPSLAPTRET